MWELWSGRELYDEVRDLSQLPRMVCEGVRPGTDGIIDDLKLCTLLQQCWHGESTQRPKVSALCTTLPRLSERYAPLDAVEEEEEADDVRRNSLRTGGSFEDIDRYDDDGDDVPDEDADADADAEGNEREQHSERPSVAAEAFNVADNTAMAGMLGHDDPGGI